MSIFKRVVFALISSLTLYMGKLTELYMMGSFFRGILKTRRLLSLHGV